MDASANTCCADLTQQSQSDLRQVHPTEPQFIATAAASLPSSKDIAATR